MPNSLVERLPGETDEDYKRRYNRAYYLANQARLVAMERQRRIDNGEKIRLRGREKYKESPEKKKSSHKKWYSKNKVHRSEYNKRWRSNNLDYLHEYKALHKDRDASARALLFARNADLYRAKNAEWIARNPDKNSARVARRNARKRKACPAWVNMDAIKAVYEEAKRLERETGIPHHVDHIVPLHNSRVCGLHVPWNLRAIPAMENVRKGDRLTPEVLELCRLILPEISFNSP